jgi:excisionase family DNA binding protein
MSTTFDTPYGPMTIHLHDDDRPESELLPERGLMTPDDAAHYLSLRRSTLDDYARRGIVPSVRVGRHRRYRADDLRDYVAGL